MLCLCCAGWHGHHLLDLKAGCLGRAQSQTARQRLPIQLRSSQTGTKLLQRPQHSECITRRFRLFLAIRRPTEPGPPRSLCGEKNATSTVASGLKESIFPVQRIAGRDPIQPSTRPGRRVQIRSQMASCCCIIPAGQAALAKSGSEQLVRFCKVHPGAVAMLVDDAGQAGHICQKPSDVGASTQYANRSRTFPWLSMLRQ